MFSFSFEVLYFMVTMEAEACSATELHFFILAGVCNILLSRLVTNSLAKYLIKTLCTRELCITPDYEMEVIYPH